MAKSLPGFRRRGHPRLCFVLMLACMAPAACNRPRESNREHPKPRIEDYATIESISNGVPVWSFSNLVYIYGTAPDLVPDVQMQERNRHSRVKIQPKKSWEIKYNLCGAESEMTRRSAYNDSQPMLPIHLIDGDTNTAWSSFEFTAAEARPEWIRIDLPVESLVASVALLCVKNSNPNYGNYGKALPKEIEVKTSRDALKWETVYLNKNVKADQPAVEVQFKARPAKQIWIIGNNLPALTAAGDFDKSRYAFSLGEVEVRDPAGTDLALVSRGGSVTVSSTSYVMLNDRFTQEALWGPLNYDLGNKWIRFGADNGSFLWHYVEHEKGQLEIDPVADESVTELLRNRVNVILNLDFKGSWIYENPPRKTNWLEARFREINDGYNDPPPAADNNPEMYQGYLRFVEYMVRHFKDRVAYFEIGNEWNASFGAERYIKTFFEPTYKIIRQIAPNAKVMLGSPAGFDQNIILDCLGEARKSGIEDGKLVASAEGIWWGAPTREVVIVRQDVKAKDVTVSVDARNDGQTGIILGYQDDKNYLAALYAPSSQTILFQERTNGSWGPTLAAKKVEKLGPNLHLSAKAAGPTVTVTVSDGHQSVSTTYILQHATEAGGVGLTQHWDQSRQLFDNFLVTDAQGKTLVKDEFTGPNGTVPSGWKYVTGGLNPISKGVGPRVNAIGWHPGGNDAAYFSAVREFQKKCRDLGFKGEFFATEIYAGSMYPPGPPKTSSEIQMAKYLVKSLVGHNGLGMEAGPCHPHFSAYAHPQALCQTTWPMQTLHPVRPTMTYYMWRTIATVMDDFRPAQFPVNFSGDKVAMSFAFQRGANERMVAAWMDGPEKDEIIQTKTDITLPGVQAKRATVVETMNGTEQELEFVVNGTDTVLKGMLIKDYPVFIRISQ
jgi:hypothetical protein